MSEQDVIPADQRLHHYAARWNVVIESTHTTETSIMAVGTRRSSPVVLKVARFRADEWRAGELLASWAGHGAVPVLEHEPGAVLMPRLAPAHDLARLCAAGHDEDATAVMAGVVGQLASVTFPIAKGFRSAEDLLPDFQRYRQRAVGVFENEVVERAERIFRKLSASQRSVGVRHGDLHHYNVLFDDTLGWTVIDPQGIIADLEFELGAFLRNPIEAPTLLSDPRVLERRLDIFHQHLGIDRHRALLWAFSQAVLAILWPTEPGVGINLTVPFAAFVNASLHYLDETERSLSSANQPDQRFPHDGTA